MADTYTQALKARKIEPGAYDPDWSERFNEDVVDIFDASISGQVTVDIGSNTTYTLAAMVNGTLSQTHYWRLNFVGTPASAVTITIPASVMPNKEYLIDNQTGQALTIKYAATVGVTVQDGDVIRVLCNGTTVRDIIFNGVAVGPGRNTGNARGTAVGNGALQSTGAGEDNTAVGYQAMTVCSGLRNTAIGSRSMVVATSAYQNVAIGNESLKAMTTGSRNVAVGESALFSLIDFAENTAIGAAALYSCNSHKNTAVGREAGYYITSGEHNVAIGYDALINMTTGSNNTAVGTFAAQGGVVNGATGAGNVAVGHSSMAQMTTATNNVAVGLNALTAVTTGGSCVAVGKDALLSMTTGQTNVAVGRIALDACTTGGENTAVGDNSLPSLTTGTGNTAIGKDANGTTTGTNNTALGHSTLTGLTTETNCTGVGYQAAVTGSNQVQLGNSSTTTYTYGAVQDRSDARDKADIRDTVLGLDFILALRPVDFRWDYREDYGSDVKDGTRKRSRFHHGLIAQEVKQTLDSLGIDFGGYQDHRIAGGKDVLSLGYGEFAAPLIKAIQELDARLNALEAA